MRIGFSLPQYGATAGQATELARFAQQAEALGADSLWVGDRLLAPVNPTVGYLGGDTIPAEYREILDPFVALSVAAAVTRTAQLGTNVINAPWYPPALLARSLTAIDVVSGGRLLPGFGTGWSPEEYQAAASPMGERGKRLDECLDALEQLWTADPAEYHGEHWTVPATHAGLKPAQRPRPPIYLAAFSPAAIRRVARRADGWIPAVMPGTGPIDLTAAVTGPLAQIRRLAEQNGRDPGGIDTILRVYPTSQATVEDILTTVQRVGDDTDVRHVLIDLMHLASTIDQALDMTGTILDSVGNNG